MKKIIVTGGNGFIGSNLADMLLKKNFNVVGIDNLSYGVLEQVPKGVDFHNKDIRNKDIYKLFNDIDCVFHLASHTPLEKNKKVLQKVNLEGTKKLFNEIKSITKAILSTIRLLGMILR